MNAGKLWAATKALFNRCVFCRKRRRNGEGVSFIRRWNAYWGETYCYHKSCLHDVVNDPEDHGHKAVDLALDIHNCKEYEEQNERLNVEWREMKLRQIRAIRDRTSRGG